MSLASNIHELLLGGSTGTYSYTINNSLRFRSSASAYLSRTPASSGSQTTWTWSGWVKRGDITTTVQMVFGAYSTSAGAISLYFANQMLQLGNNAGTIGIQTNAIYRDPSAWYHIVVVLNTTSATPSNRLVIYVNGLQPTVQNATYPSQNATYDVNASGVPHNMFRQASTGSYPADGYLAEVNFIDGQALDASYFGATNSTTGTWAPKAYSGSYGTNGFYLPFSDTSGLTSGSNTGIGKDFSGNGNYWTTNNISLTAGSTYDWMLDSPTPYQGSSYGVGNYAVLNLLGKSAYASISGGNLNISWVTNASANFAANASTISFPNSGKWYFELSNASADGNNGIGVGICDVTKIANGGDTTPTTYYLYRSDANNTFNGYTSNAGSGSTGSTFLGGAICGIAVDLDNGKFWAAINNTWQGGGNPATGTSPGYSGISSSIAWVPFVGGWNWTGTATSASINFGQRPFQFSPPAGFKALQTYNLPTPAIKKGNQYFDVVTRAGTGAVASVSSLQFAPDFVWSKARNNLRDPYLADIVRGVNKALMTDLTSAELTTTNGLIAFGANGYTIGSSAGDSTAINLSTDNYVDWVWKAGGTAVTNTAGSITSSVSANPTAGFAIVTYTGNGTAGATVGHGLGVAPSMIIAKTRSSVMDWFSYHASLGVSQYIALNSTAAAGAATNYWGSNASTFALSAGGNNVNGSTMIAYCFAAIPGYSAFGSYTGNGSTDGPFVFTGFLPKFILVKRTDTIGNWCLFDSSRLGYNGTSASKELYPNLSNAEGSSNGPDQLSNGFKFRDTYSDVNASGGTYVYACFASNPFQYSLAR